MPCGDVEGFFSYRTFSLINHVCSSISAKAQSRALLLNKASGQEHELERRWADLILPSVVVAVIIKMRPAALFHDLFNSHAEPERDVEECGDAQIVEGAAFERSDKPWR